MVALLDATLKALRFEEYRSDSKLYLNSLVKRMILILVYVDDMLVGERKQMFSSTSPHKLVRK